MNLSESEGEKMSKKDEKNTDKALEQVLKDIEKQFGAGAIMKLGTDEHIKIDVTSSNAPTINIIFPLPFIISSFLLSTTIFNII